MNTVQRSDFILNLRLVMQDLPVTWAQIRQETFVLFSVHDISGITLVSPHPHVYYFLISLLV